MEKDLDFRPIGNRVLVKRPVKKNEEVTASGIIIPDTVESSREFETISTILKVGDEVTSLKEGQKIKYENPHLLTHRGEEYYLINERNVLLIIED